MRILIVTKQFYPDQNPRAFRSFELARELAAQGHFVRVYTAITGYDYTSLEEECGFEVKSMGEFKFIKTRRDKDNTSTAYDKMLTRLLGRLLYFPQTELTIRLPNILKNETGYDILISIAMPFSVHWGCALALDSNKKLAKTWVADCGDPFMGNVFTKHPFYFKYVERWFCKKVDYITVPTKEAVNAYESAFRSKIRVIPQGFRFDKLPIVSKGNRKPTFAYAGVLYKDKRDPSLLLEYLSKLEVDFKFILYTRSVDLLTPFLSVLGDKLEIRSLVSRKELLEELCKMDFLVNVENSVVEQSPSKLIDYALTGLPILSVSSTNVDYSLVDEFLVANYRRSFVVENVEQYNIINVARQFLDLHCENVDVSA